MSCRTGEMLHPLSIFGLAACLAAASAWELANLADAPDRLDPDLVVPASFPQAERLSLQGGVDWINTGPISLQQLRGKIVLLDFWTYCCINCHHILPDLAKLEQKYANELVVIGVHTPKFEAERDTTNIREKVREYRIKHPVINDAHMTLWRRFGVQSWPTLVLIDARGRYEGSIAGEGHYEILDKAIGRLVERHKARQELKLAPLKFEPEMDRPSTAPLLFPGKVLADPAGKRLFVTDTGHNRIIMSDLDGKNPVAIGNGEEGLQDGVFAQARFNRPQGLCLDGDTLYVADTENHAIRAIDLKQEQVTTLAGTGSQSRRPTIERYSGPAATSALSSPWDLTMIPGQRMLYIAMAGPHQIWRLDLERGEIGVFAGSGYEDIEDGDASSSKFAQPSGITNDGQNLYVADSEVSGLRMISQLSGEGGPIVRTIVGRGLFAFGDADGSGGVVRLQHCLGVCFSEGLLYVADTYNNKIKVCNIQRQAVRTLVGAHQPGHTDRPPRFYQPGGVSAVPGVLYVADTNNHAVRKVDLKTGSVSTIDFDGLKPPAPPARKPVFPNARVVNLDPVQLAPTQAIKLQVNIPLPAGFHLNEAVPMPVAIDTPETPGLIAASFPIEGRQIKPPAQSFHLEVPLGRALKAGDHFRLQVSTSTFVCSKGSNVCMIKSFVWNVPVTIADSGAQALSLDSPSPQETEK